MRNKIIALAALAAAAFIGLGSVSAPAQAAYSVTGTVTVSGSGSMTLNRDQATSSLTVSYLGKTAKDAMAQTTSIYNRLRSAILALGVKSEKITTSGISLYPEYEYNYVNGRNETTLKGYRSTASMSVITTVPMAATVLDTAVSVGGDDVQIGGVSFDVANPEDVTDTTRVRAMQNAKMKAQDYAEALGGRIGRVTKIVENSAAVPVPIYYGMAKAAASADAINIDPGNQKVTSSVTVTFELLG